MVRVKDVTRRSDFGGVAVSPRFGARIGVLARRELVDVEKQLVGRWRRFVFGLLGEKTEAWVFGVGARLSGEAWLSAPVAPNVDRVRGAVSFADDRGEIDRASAVVRVVAAFAGRNAEVSNGGCAPFRLEVRGEARECDRVPMVEAARWIRLRAIDRAVYERDAGDRFGDVEAVRWSRVRDAASFIECDGARVKRYDAITNK